MEHSEMDLVDERPASRDSHWSLDVEDIGDVVYGLLFEEVPEICNFR